MQILLKDFSKPTMVGTQNGGPGAQDGRQASSAQQQPQPSTTANMQPTDASKIVALLQSMGVEDYEPRIVNQLTDFMYRYVTDVLLDAEAYAEHSGKAAGHVGFDDVMLAIQARSTHSFAQPPDSEEIKILAQAINSKELKPFPANKNGIIYPDADNLMNQNYQLKL